MTHSMSLLLWLSTGLLDILLGIEYSHSLTASGLLRYNVQQTEVGLSGDSATESDSLH